MLVKASLYAKGIKTKDLTMEDIMSFSLPPKVFFWAALFEPTEIEIKQVFSKVKIHELALEDLIHGGQMPKIDEYDENLFVVANQIEFDNTNGELITGEVYIFSGENYVISIRKGIGKPFTATRHFVEKKPGLLKYGSGYVLYAILDAVVDRYFPVMTKVENELVELENQIFDNKESLEYRRDVIEKLHKFKGKIRILKSCIDPLMDSTSKLFGGRVPDICENLDNYFRDVHDHLSRLSASLDNLSEAATASIQTSVAVLAIEDNKVTKKLAAWAAIFAMVTFMAGVWGMNFSNMPEISWKYGYPLALSLMVLAALILRYHFKKMKWI